MTDSPWTEVEGRRKWASAAREAMEEAERRFPSCERIWMVRWRDQTAREASRQRDSVERAEEWRRVMSRLWIREVSKARDLGVWEISEVVF